MNESKPKNLQENKPNTEHISISLSPNNKKFLPWIIALISIVCVVSFYILEFPSSSTERDARTVRTAESSY